MYTQETPGMIVTEDRTIPTAEVHLLNPFALRVARECTELVSAQIKATEQTIWGSNLGGGDQSETSAGEVITTVTQALSVGDEQMASLTQVDTETSQGRINETGSWEPVKGDLCVAHSREITYALGIADTERITVKELFQIFMTDGAEVATLQQRTLMGAILTNEHLDQIVRTIREEQKRLEKANRTQNKNLFKAILSWLGL